MGFTYTWMDSDGLVDGQTFYYWLEDVDVAGATTLHGPVSVTYAAPTAVTLQGISAGPVPAAGAVLPVVLMVTGVAATLDAMRRRRPM